MAGALFEAMKAGATTAEPGSYNVVLTLQHLHLIPRLREFSGPVACNALVSRFCALARVQHARVFLFAWVHMREGAIGVSTEREWRLRGCVMQGFARTLFVRSVEELEYTRSRGPLQILADVGLPW